MNSVYPIVKNSRKRLNAIVAVQVLIALSLARLFFVPWLDRAQTFDDTSSQHHIIDWVRSNGGYFSTKQQFRRANDDPKSYFGIFAVQDIEKGELLTRVPWKCIITARDAKKVRGGYYFCGSTRRLIKEMRKGSKSFYYPYTSYLLGQPRGKIPSDWSDAGKDLLKQVLGYDMLPPRDAVDLIDLWKQSCRVKGENDPLEEQAFIEYHARADDGVLIPLYDLYNHAQGNQANVLITVTPGQSQDVIAGRTIQKGEQLGFSYSLSPHMSYGPDMYYDTPDFFRDYGFVEPLPQQWGFLDQAIHFSLHEGKDGNQEVTWLRTPSPGDATFLREQLERLHNVVQPHLEQIEKQARLREKDTTNKNWSTPTERELATIRQYFNSLKTAISAALGAFPGRSDEHDF